ncbi:MAG: methionyl-tRNA formyltransferase [Ignavibacteriales bacterium]|nr:methionyl-tRNA formyltransferase [Ignavibacteriales bacterium]
MKIILENNHEIGAVVTVPDKPAGRGLKLTLSPVKEFSLEHKLSILQPERLKDSQFISRLKTLNADVFVIVAFRILPQEVFTIPKYGSFNLHASLLPKYRGAAPINWAIIGGEKETGVTTFFLEESVDTGNIILQARTPIGQNETAGELHDKLAQIGAEIVLHSLRLIESGKVIKKVQDESQATPAPKILKENCRINWNLNARDIHNFIRGLAPKPTAFTYHNSTLLKIYRSSLIIDKRRDESGQVLQTDRKLVVGTFDGAIEIMEIQQEGRKRLSAEEFLRGYPMKIGDKFS